MLKKPPDTGDKEGAYFVRGPFADGQSTRSDANLPYANLIVLDGDSRLDPATGDILEGAPDPEAVHHALVTLDITHVLHTTHSHGQPGKGSRFRVLIPAMISNSAQLRGYLDWLFHRLNAAGCWLVDVRENGAWSQPWYFPRLASEDSDYRVYVHDAGKQFDHAAASAWLAEKAPFQSPALEAHTTPSSARPPDSPYARFNQAHGSRKWMLQTLTKHGYGLVSTSTINEEMAYRLRAPASSSGNAGTILFRGQAGDWRVYSHHGTKDPLSAPDRPVSTCDAWDVYCILEHGGDEQTARAAWDRTLDPRPLIRIVGGEIAPNLTTAIGALAALEPPTIYQRAQTLCRIAHLSEISETQGCTIPKGTAHIVTLGRSSLTVELSQAARWERYKKKRWIAADPCPKVTGALLEAVGMWEGIPPLLGISEAPILRRDGTVLAEPGYDIASRLYVEGRFPEFILPDHIGPEEAKGAAETLLDPFREFPLVDEQLGRSVLLAYLFTLALRPQLVTAPLFCISATTPGSGKGLLVEVANRIVRGRDAATMPPVQGSGGEEETRKRITALLVQGISSANLDNWSKPIGGEAMNALLTTTEWTDRVLGASTTVSLPNRITLAATGNNLSVRGDMVRRSLLLQLDPEMERPELREFQEKDLPGRVTGERAALLLALFSILKGYQQAGRPEDGKALLGRFEQWSDAVCGPVRWLGFPDPLESQELLRAQDPEVERLELLLSNWYSEFGSEWTTVNALTGRATEQDANHGVNRDPASTLHEALVEAAPDNRGGINPKKLGWYLRHFTGRIAGGYKLERQPRSSESSHATNQYRVICLQGGEAEPEEEWDLGF